VSDLMLKCAVNFGPFIAYTNIDTESLNILREYINDVMKWVCHVRSEVCMLTTRKGG